MTAANVLFLKPPAGGARGNAVRDFLYGCWCNGRRIGGMQMPPLTELYVATHARKAGVKSDFLDAQIEGERFGRIAKDKYQDYFAVAVMTSTQSFKSDLAVLEQVKSYNPHIHTIMYGSHPTFMPDYCLSESGIDFIVLGEPEESVRQLLSALVFGGAPSEVPGVGWKDNEGAPIVNPRTGFIDINELPIPDRSLLPAGVDYFNPVVKNIPYTTMMTSRGCPGRCNFCTSPFFYGNKTRARSVELVVEELRQIKNLGYREVFFRDETFTAYKGRNLKIFDAMLSENMELSWIANGRVDMVDRENMRAMKRAGCHLIKFGVESGDDAILENLNKGTTVSQAEEAFRIAREEGLDTHAHIMFGAPGESVGTIRKTVEFAKRIRATTVSFGILTPYAGTELFEQVAAFSPEIRDGSQSTMENLHVEGFYSEAVCGIPAHVLSGEITRAYRQFYIRPGYLMRRLAGIKSWNELVVSIIGGINVFQFALSGKK